MTASHTSIHPATEMGPLSLTVADLEHSQAFYTDLIGFQVLGRDDAGVTLGAGGVPLLHLAEERGARPWPRDTRSHTGLYHFAILLPTRADLGRWLRHWMESSGMVPGQGDHLVSEALYLEDPDGNGIEVYRDRPRDAWTMVNGQVRMGTGPVDIQGLLQDAAQEGKPWSGLPAGTRIGHVHLQVADIAEAARFYSDVLGFDIMASMPSALFVSAGGYHHHLGLNTWHSKGGGPAPAGTAGLRSFTIVLPSEEARREVIDRIEHAGLEVERRGDSVTVHDPWHTRIHLRVGSVAPEHIAEVFATSSTSA